MSRLRGIAVVFLLLSAPPRAAAGLYYSAESIAELPSQWRGFLLDQRALRGIAVKPTPKLAASPMRVQYEQAAASLEKARAGRKLTPDEYADLGALYVRLGEVDRALAVLRIAQAEHPHHFRIAANLGTAWQLRGDLNQAAAALTEAVRLAPGKYQKAEELHLKLVRLRQRAPRETQELDNLFGVRYGAEGSKYEAGKLAEAQRHTIASDTVALAQQLALWLPADGRLLWQLGELANAHGDVRTAAAILDGCVTEFGMHSPTLREHRRIIRAAADALAQGAGGQAEHERNALVLRPRSKRPLANRLDTAQLPAINPNGVTPLPWAVLAETAVDREFHPTFAKYLRELDGKQVSLTGFIQPLGEDHELGSFMFIEYPIGCWYCEMPEMASIVFVEMPAGKTAVYTRSQVKVTGTLKLNSTDPENFLYTISSAKVTEAD